MRTKGKITKIEPIKLTPYQKGFLEGLIDGEGCLSFTRGIYKGQLYFSSCLTIANTSLPLLQKAYKIIKRGYIKGRKPLGKSSYKVCYSYCLKPNDLRYLLPSINLIVKEEDRKNILKALKLAIVREKYSRWRKNYKLKEMNELYKKLRKRNGN
jgi:hypothetical protein